MQNQKLLAAAVSFTITFTGMSVALGETPIKPHSLTTSAWKIPSPATTDVPGGGPPASLPKSFPDENAFQSRADIIIAGLATNDLQTWRKGYFTGGDPAKYTFAPIMAKLILDPKAPDAIKMQNDDRSYKEQYHFGCVNWSRFLPIFGSVLNDETQTNLDKAVGKYGYLGVGGTENHKIMWLTSANVEPLYTKTGRLQNMGKEAALAKAKADLQQYVKGLYAAGQGEWDSSTYLMFDLNGMLNVYDFAQDPEVRLLARAALDWYATSYALKYTDAVYCAPNQRGFAHAYAEKIADNTGWLWWGGSQPITPENTKRWLWTMHPMTSGWRPNAVITNIAHRNLTQLPFEQNNSKPNYWKGANAEPKPNQMQETVYVAKEFTMGSLWTGIGVQTARFEVVARTPNGPVAFSGGHPGHIMNDGNKRDGGISYADGNGSYDQSAQTGATYVSLSNIPADEPLKYSFFSAPEEIAKPIQKGNWFIMQAGNTFLGVYGLGDKNELGETDTPPDAKKPPKKFPILRFAGEKTGFILQVGDAATYKSADAFAAALAKITIQRTGLDVSFTDLAGKAITVKYAEGQSHAETTVNGNAITFNDWPVYNGPYINQKSGVLAVNDGKDGFTIDFTGELPVYKPWTK